MLSEGMLSTVGQLVRHREKKQQLREKSKTDLFPIPNINFESQDFSFRYMSSGGEDRYLSAAVHALSFRLRKDDAVLLPDLEVAIDHLTIDDATGTCLKITKCSSDVAAVDDAWQCKCQVEDPVFNVSEESLLWWMSYGKKFAGFSSFRSSVSLDTTSTATTSSAFEKCANSGKIRSSVSLEVFSFLVSLKPQIGSVIQMGVDYTALNTTGLHIVELGVETAWCRRLRQFEEPGRPQFNEGTHCWQTQLFLGAFLVQLDLTKLWEHAECIGTIKTMNCVYKKDSKELMVQTPHEFQLIWSPAVHMNLCDCYRNARAIVQKFPSLQKHQGTLPDEEKRNPARLILSVVCDSSITLAATLPQKHRIEVVFDKLRIQGTKANLVFQAPNASLVFDGKKIVKINNFNLEKLEHHDDVQGCRRNFKEFKTAKNPLWSLSVSNFAIIFPFGYDFAAAYEEALNAFKWVKLIHSIQKKPFTLDNPLPPDLSICVQEFHFQLCDDPFEVKLRDNYELLLDEAYESERRIQMLESKLEELRRNHPLLPRAKSEELYRSLLYKNSVIYVERSRQMGPQRTHLISWRVEGIEIRVIADKILHGQENVLRFMKQVNPESSLPPDGTEFTTMWARGVELDFERWIVEFRDYPQPYMFISDGHLWGKLAGVEQLGAERSRRSCSLDLGEPWGNFQVSRNMPPLKFFYDLCCDLGQFNVAYGPCWEPCLAMINLCFNNVNHPSLDPSCPLPFWDKIRLLLHGRLSMFCGKLTAVLLASPDPYNTTEQMEIAWEEFAFDWTTGLILVQANVDAFVRTASKYDDIKLFHLPDLKLSIRLDWSCLGDCHDHFSVAPYAPDKLPEYTLNQEHDSYRAFRSQYLNVALTLEVKQKGDSSSDSRCPQMLLYANTFRFLQLLKNTLSAVNRPVKHGKLFSTPRQKRPQLSRHYKNIQLCATLPRFLISYWMSFSSPHGFRLSCSSLRLNSSHQLTFQTSPPTADQLQRRSHSVWSIGHVSSELLDAEIHLFAAKRATDAEFSSDKNRSFFVGLDRLSYARESTAGRSQANLQSEDFPIHRLIAFGLRGAWTSDNRDAILAIFDGIQKSRVLRRNLSTDALKILQFADEKPKNKRSSAQKLAPAGSPPPGRFEGSHAANMLQQLIEEANTKFVAYSEEGSSLNYMTPVVKLVDM